MAWTSEEQVTNKKWEVAYNYVFRTVGNKSQAIKLYFEEHQLEMPKHLNTEGYRYFKDPEVISFVEQLRKELREDFKEQRDKNVAALNEIAFNYENSVKERTAAIKELNTMFGYNSQNINVAGSAALEIVIE